MGNKIKVVCPKCQVKLRIAPEKVKSEVAKFKCPQCSTVLRIKKPADKDQEIRPVQQSPGESAKGQTVEQNVAQGNEVSRPADQEEETLPDNLRTHKRVKFKQKVLVDNQIMVEALDISEGGLFLHTGRSFDDGSLVEVGIPTQPGNFDLKVQARVQHNHRGIGMGMQFVDLDAKQKADLDKLINSLDKTAREEFVGRKKILLVGGSDTARNINKSKLVLDGFYVMQATSVDEVFNTLQDEPPDAMVLEWQETKFLCKGLLSRIKANSQFDQIIIVVLSALTDADIHREIIDAGADRSMAKMDTNPAKLSQALKELIDKRDG
jgi:CheY-like chemotaxis protein